MQLADNFTRTRVFAELGTRPTGRRHPKCTVPEVNSEEYLDCFIRENTMSGYHLAGTCRMGAAGDHSAVVDPQLRCLLLCLKMVLNYKYKLNQSINQSIVDLYSAYTQSL